MGSSDSPRLSNMDFPRRADNIAVNMNTALSRRQFLASATAIAVAGLARPARAAPPSQPVAPRASVPEVIRVGLIGIDGHYSEITSAARALPGVQITAIAETRPDLRRRATSDPALARARLYSDFRQLLDSGELDVVAICGENGARAGTIQACAERGLPIIAEKPLATTPGDLARVKRAVTARHVPLTMLLPMRCYPEYQVMRRLIREGDLGEVVSIHAQKSYKLGERPDWMKHPQSYGGTIPFIGIHMVDLMRWTSGREFVETAAFQSNVGFPSVGDMENNAVVLFKLDNRGTASLRLDYLRPAGAPTHGDDRLRVAGTKGIVEYQDGGPVTLLAGTRPPQKLTQLPPANSLVADFLHSLYGGPPHLLSTDDIFRVNEIVLKARQAADSGRLVRL
jgi:predicted dehydrogenase